MITPTPSPFLYDTATPAAVIARKRDDEHFARHPEAHWRVRPLFEGESPIAEGLRTRAPGWRAYALVIDHARAGDKRARAGRGVYPVVVPQADGARTQALLRAEAERWARWFRTSATTPPPRRGNGVLL
jgi:hypothetical protein